MKLDELDTVVLLKDIPDAGLRKGDMGAVVMVYTEPNEAYEVEFVSEDGKTRAMLVLLPDEIERVK